MQEEHDNSLELGCESIAIHELYENYFRSENACAALEDLVRDVNQLCFTGSYISGDGLVHSAESLSESAVGSFIRRVCESIMGAIRAMIDYIRSMGDVHGRIVRAQNRLEARAKTSLNRSIRVDEIPVRSEVIYLMVRGALPTSERDYVSRLEELNRQFKIILDHHVPAVEKFGEELARIIDSIDKPSEVGKSLEEIADKFKLLGLESLQHQLLAKPYKDDRFRANEVVAAPPLTGDKSIFIRMPPSKADLESMTNARRASVLRSSSAFLDKTENAVRSIGSDETVPTLDATAVSSLCVSIKGTLTLIEHYSRGNVRSRMEAVGRKLTEAVSKLGRLGVEDKSQVTAIANIASGFVRWSTSPHRELSMLSTSVCHAMLAVGFKSINAHS